MLVATDGDRRVGLIAEVGMPDQPVMGSERFGPRTAVAVDGLLAEAGASTWAGGQRCTLDSLLHRWTLLAEQVEEGYISTGPEFSNDTWCRGVLESVWSRLPAQVRAAGQAQLERADAQFIAATFPWPDHEDETKWWQWRFPRELGVFPDEGYESGWPPGWAMMPFPKPDEVGVSIWD